MEIHGTMPGVSPPPDDEPKFDGPSLDTEGNLDRRFRAVEPSDFKPPEETFELETRERIKPQAEIPPAPAPPDRTRRGALKLVLGLLAVAVLGLVGLLVFKPRIPIPHGVTPSFLGLSSANGQLIVTSTPSGANVTIGDSVVGTTPWAVDNRWDGDIKVRITARGYKTWEGTFTGGVDQTLNAELQPLKK